MPDSPEVVERVQEGLRLVEQIAHGMRRQFGSYVQVDDLVSQGRETLLQAARGFEADRGIPFKRWAALRVRGSMIDSMRASGGLPKRVYRKLRALQAMHSINENAVEERAAAPPATPEAADAALTAQLESAAMAAAAAFLAQRDTDASGDIAAEQDHSPESNVSFAEMTDRLKEAIEERPDQERQLLRRIYFDDLTIDEAARELGLSKSWGSRLHARAIEGLQRSLKRARVE